MGRTLVYIPIIHTDPDLGTLASDVEERASGLLGKRWQEHKRIINSYWQEISRYFEGRNINGTKIFQDGLPVGGKAALEMINELAQTGSPNYQLLKDLSKRGARVIKTEDTALLKKEYQLTKNLVAKKNLLWAILAFLNYKLKKDKLLEARDRYIADQINQNLKEKETGVCFLGAYHQILPKLAKDIRIVLFKDPEKVKDYYKNLASGKNLEIKPRLAALLNFQSLSKGEKKETIDELGRYLIKPEK